MGRAASQHSQPLPALASLQVFVLICYHCHASTVQTSIIRLRPANAITPNGHHSLTPSPWHYLKQPLVASTHRFHHSKLASPRSHLANAITLNGHCPISAWLMPSLLTGFTRECPANAIILHRHCLLVPR